MFSLVLSIFFFFFKQKTAYEMRISDWSSDVCSSDLAEIFLALGFDRLVVENLVVAPADRLSVPGPVLRSGLERPPIEEVAVADRDRGFVLLDAQIGRASCRERVCQYV